MSLTENYNRQRTVSSNTPSGASSAEKAIATEYGGNFDVLTSTANIGTAQALVTNIYKPLVFVKDKVNDLIALINTVQGYWATWINNITSRLHRIGDTVTTYSESATYNVGDMVMYGGYQYMCIGQASGTWDAGKWQMITPSSFGWNWADKINKIVTNGKIQLVDKADSSKIYATMLSDLAYCADATDEANIGVGAVYLLKE